MKRHRPLRRQKPHSRQPVVSLLGTGAWGGAIAAQLRIRGFGVRAYNRDAAPILRLQRKGVQRVLSLEALIEKAETLIVALPSEAIESLAKPLASLPTTTRVLCLTKGLRREKGEPLSSFFNTHLGEGGNLRYALLSGPSFAIEVEKRLPTAVTIASEELATAQHFQALLSDLHFRVYTSTDVVGVEIGGALKNVIAIACGISDGLGLGHNSRAALITRGLAEITRLGVRLGADPNTFRGLSGVGDLILTCCGDLSRNRRLGLLLAKRVSLSSAKKRIRQTIEGVETARHAHILASRVHVEMPICCEVHRILFKRKAPRRALLDLMSRGLKEEAP